MPTVLQFLQQHPLLLQGLGVWALLSLVINAVLAVRGPQAWVDMAKKNPKLALIINILFRAFGIDLVSVLLHVRDYINSRAASESSASKDPPTPTEPVAEPSEEKKS